MFFKLASIAALIASASAHMQVISPCPRYSSHGEKCPALPAGVSFDYSMSSPLDYNAPLCKHTTPYATPSATWTAGQSVTVKFAEGGAPHGGGHCQFSLSYDGGKTFVVVHEELEHCFFNGAAAVHQYTFNLPSNLPGSDKAVFAWSWVNAIGNREFYMNCADVAIKGTSGSFTGKEMTVANHNGYPTIPEFGGNSKTGLEIYAKAKQVTVTGNGGSGPAPGPAPSSSTTPVYTTASVTTRIPHGPSPTAPVSSAPAPTSAPTSAPTASPTAPSATSTKAPAPTPSTPPTTPGDKSDS
ncbi:hypothetical protein GGI12_005377, partial [Dipsacomyces acuminosporus]